MNLPSKELLTEVLGVRPIVEMQYEFDSDYNTYFIRTNSGKESIYPYFLIDPTITIVSDLAHKCKEWAFKQDKYRWLFSYKAFIDCWCDIIDNHDRNNIIKRFSGDTEPEAIFKACQWILANKKQKGGLDDLGTNQ